MKSKKIYTILLVLIILLQVLTRFYIGSRKEYYHMDEAYSYGLMNYDKLNIADNEDFYNNWHTKEYYIDYFAVNKDEVSDFNAVYENQKNDVHPPLYYLLLRIAATSTVDAFSKWTGITLNIIIFIFSSILVYKISKRLLKNPIYALITTAISGFTMASIETTIYIRMYELSAFNILLITYLNLKVFDKDTIRKRDLCAIGIALILGGLTHYYFFIYALGIYLVFMCNSIKNKRYAILIKYTIMVVIAAIAYLAIFPYAIDHIFFGYRGTGQSMTALGGLKIFIKIATYLWIVNQNIFAKLLPLVILLIILMCRKGDSKKEKKHKRIAILLVPTILYFVMVAILSPYDELRYIMPICSAITILTIYYMKKFLSRTQDNKSVILIIVLTFLILFSIAKLSGMKLDMTYEKYNNIAGRVEEYKLPIIYIFNTNNNRYLDDVYLFTIAENSYILKYEDASKENVFKVIDEKCENGFILMLNEGINEDEIFEFISEEGYEDKQYVQRMNACNIYVLKP